MSPANPTSKATLLPDSQDPGIAAKAEVDVRHRDPMCHKVGGRIPKLMPAEPSTR